MSSAGKSGKGFPGWAGSSAGTSDFNRMSFLVQQAMALFRTCTIVQVKKVTNKGGVSPVGFLDVQPLVNLTDSLGQGSEHGTITGLPYLRVQGGVNAVIIDPCVGDIGIAVIADRDISRVKKTKKTANPGSYRRADLADGMYLGGILNAAPQQYVRFVQKDDGSAKGIEIVDINFNKISMEEDGIYVNGVLFDRDQNISKAEDIDNTGDIRTEGEITADSNGDGVTLTGHTHGGVDTGPGDTQPPNGGT